ncbi:MAG TPA: hypothetical protein VGO55_07940 [Allosphingosinicella sp.]|jgi:hypothetical protein|nr:hypothetical protein [Allosphingosinicella sp.]
MTRNLLPGLALLFVFALAGLMIARRSGRELGARPGRELEAAGPRARGRLVIALIVFLAGAGMVIGFLWPRNHNGEPINTVTSRW